MNAPFDVVRFESWLIWAALWLLVCLALGVIVERVAFALLQIRQQHIERAYGPLVPRALGGDEAAVRQLAASPPRHRIAILRLLIEPLIDDRDPARIGQTREVVEAIELLSRADRYLRSWWWWRRAIALRALGLVQARHRTAAIVAALDDSHPDVRAAALDALTDLRDPATLDAIVVRLHDSSLHRGRRAAALAAFGSDCEPFLLELSHVDRTHRLNYARALAICGTERSRPALCQWTKDARAEVRAAAFEALGRVGLDDHAARLALDALESTDAHVRAMAASALHGWNDGGDAAARLAHHLDDEWQVAVCAARSLQSMGSAGLLELQATASRGDLAGQLARQMLWQEGAQC